MSVTDPIADMLTVIRNASRAKKEKLELPSSKLKLKILEVFKKEGFIKNYKLIEDKRQGLVKVYLRFNRDKSPVINNIKRISTPGLRIYAPKDKIPQVLRGMGLAVLSTSSGVITDTQARNLGVGGEIICYIW